MKELQFKLMHKRKLEEVMNRLLATKQASSVPNQAAFYVERRLLDSTKTQVYFEDLGSIH